MKKVFDSYLEEYYKDFNDLSIGGYEKSALFYGNFYKDILPVDKNARILDLACGAGQFLYFLKQQGCKNYYGVDISEQQIKFCINMSIPEVQVSDALDFIKSKKEEFDVIVVNDFLEHLKKEKLFDILELIHNSLKKNGRILIKTPNMSNPFSLVNRYIDITHEIGFTEYSIEEVLKVSGFKDVKIKEALSPIFSIKSLMQRIAAKLSHSVIGIFLLAEGNHLPKVLGKEMIVVAFKNNN